MLLQPVVVSTILARQWDWTMAAAVCGVIAVFLIRQPMIVLARQCYVWKDAHPETAVAWRWFCGLGLASALAGAALYKRWPLALLAALAMGAGAMTVLAVWATIRNKQRAVWLQILSASGLTSAAVAVEVSACGFVRPWALWLWCGLALQSIAAILVVHARLDAKIHAKRKNAPPLERPTAAYVAQVVLLNVAAVLAAYQHWWLAAAMALPGLVNAVELIQIGDNRTLDVPLKTVGFKAMALSLAVNALLLLGLWPTGGCAVP